MTNTLFLTALLTISVTTNWTPTFVSDWKGPKELYVGRYQTNYTFVSKDARFTNLKITVEPEYGPFQFLEERPMTNINKWNTTNNIGVFTNWYFK